MDTEKILKWGVLLVLAYVALKWFTNILTGVASDATFGGVSSGYQYGLPYNPNGVIANRPYAVRRWGGPYGGRAARSGRYTWGGR